MLLAVLNMTICLEWRKCPVSRNTSEQWADGQMYKQKLLRLVLNDWSLSSQVTHS